MPASLQAPTSAAAVSAVSHPFACLPPGFFRTTKNWWQSRSKLDSASRVTSVEAQDADKGRRGPSVATRLGQHMASPYISIPGIGQPAPSRSLGAMGGRGGIQCPLPSRPHFRGSRFSRLPPLRLPYQEIFQNDEKLVAGSARAPSPWRPRPQARNLGLLPGAHQEIEKRQAVLVLTRSGKPGFVHRLISCAQSRLRISCQS